MLCPRRRKVKRLGSWAITSPRGTFGSDKVRNLHLTAAFAHLAVNCLSYIPNFAILILVNDIHEISVLRRRRNQSRLLKNLAEVSTIVLY